MSRDPAYLIDLDNAAVKIMQFTQGLDATAFSADPLKQSAVLYQFTICGEAARRLSAEFKAQHPEIPWSQVIAFRNRVTHDYANVDLQIVWSIITDEISKLRAQLAPLLPIAGGRPG